MRQTLAGGSHWLIAFRPCAWEKVQEPGTGRYLSQFRGGAGIAFSSAARLKVSLEEACEIRHVRVVMGVMKIGEYRDIAHTKLGGIF